MKHLLTMAIVVLVGMVGLAAAPVKTLTVVAPATLTCDLNNLFTPADYYRCILYYELKPSTPQRYYLTKGTYKGAQAKNACTPGFHMASLFEILVPSGLMYLQDTNVAFTSADAGSGLPSNQQGWIRTGDQATGIAEPGVGNCQAWASQSFSDWGTVVWFTPTWDRLFIPTADLHVFITPWWETLAAQCGANLHVWCVETLN
jgi:hypothetical protein